MSILLEVIVTSAAEAVAAQQGGADRLELVRELDLGGLTPSFQIVNDVTSAVTVPVRVMIRESPSMRISNSSEIFRLREFIRQVSQCPVDGLVLGYLRDGEVDTASLDELLSSNLNVTFHRAFDEAKDPLAAISTLKQYPQVDRILTRAEGASWPVRMARLEQWQALSGPEIQMLFAIGSDTAHLSALQQSPRRYEVHVGRAARISHCNTGPLSANYVAALKTGSPATPPGPISHRDEERLPRSPSNQIVR